MISDKIHINQYHFHPNSESKQSTKLTELITNRSSSIDRFQIEKQEKLVGQEFEIERGIKSEIWRCVIVRVRVCESAVGDPITFSAGAPELSSGRISLSPGRQLMMI